MSLRLMIVAGEKSGDIHGANLVKHIKELLPNATFTGVGGDKLEEQGVELVYHMTDLAVVGAIEVLKKLRYFYGVLHDLEARLKTENIDALLLIDFPGFNLKLAEKAKRLNIPVIYYISPQFWAWKQKRIYRIARLVTKMIVILPFEKELYKKVSLDVSFVGHPMLDYIDIPEGRAELRKILGFTENEKIIGILPGSRENEIKKILPLMLKAAEKIVEKRPDIQFVIPAATSLLKEQIISLSALSTCQPVIIDQKSHEIMKTADFALVASGSATLETMFFQTPMAVIYKVSFLTWILAKLLVRIPYISLVNILAGKQIVPEYLQFQVKPDAIAQYTLSILDDPVKRQEIQEELAKVRTLLGEPGASRRAADEVVKTVKKKEN